MGDRFSQVLDNHLLLAKEIQLNLRVETCLRLARRSGGRVRDGVRVQTRRVPVDLVGPRPAGQVRRRIVAGSPRWSEEHDEFRRSEHPMAQRDDEYQPQAPDLGASVQLESGETLDGPGDGDGLDAGYVPPDRPYGLDEDGVTGAGMRAGDTLDQRLRREQGEETGGADPDRSGRITMADEGAALETPDSISGVDVGIDGGAASAEEAAMHEIDTAAGDDGYLVEVEPSVAGDPFLADPELDASLAADPRSDLALDEAARDVDEAGR